MQEAATRSSLIAFFVLGGVPKSTNASEDLHHLQVCGKNTIGVLTSMT